MRVNGVELAVERFGDRADPAIVLIGGAGSSMDVWPVAFCERLARSRFVLRYDQRDTGESTTDRPGEPSYRFPDLVADVIGILDHVGIGSAHLVGLSMGGAVAQLAALDHPGRVASLTLIATSTGPGGEKLPGMTGELRAFFATTPEPSDWTDRDAVVSYLVAFERALSGRFFDPDATRETMARVVARSHDMRASMTNHMAIPREEPWRPRLSTLEVPTLVLHGSLDPLFPPAHGQALAREIRGGRLLMVDGMGHEAPPPPTWDEVVPAILALTSGGWPRQADRLATRSLAQGDPTGWFEQLYASGVAGEVGLPWDTDAPRDALATWVRGRRGDGRRAIVVGAGLGQNAEFIAGLGFDTVAFDISPTAVRVVRERYPDSTVDYHVADLLDPPPAWDRAFDLVVEVFTVQALPLSLRARATANVARFTAPGGTLIVVAVARDAADADPPGPPWPLSRTEIDAFGRDGLSGVRVEALDGGRTWRAEFHRASGPTAP